MTVTGETDVMFGCRMRWPVTTMPSAFARISGAGRDGGGEGGA
jgi:hypothetical protein